MAAWHVSITGMVCGHQMDDGGDEYILAQARLINCFARASQPLFLALCARSFFRHSKKEPVHCDSGIWSAVM